MNTLCVHITFFYNSEKIEYLKKVIDEILKYNQFKKIDIFIHTNRSFEKINGAEQVVHNCDKLMHSTHLAWSHRALLKTQANDYDYFMYNEDDILIKSESIDYWLEYNEIVKSKSLYLGFVRIETDSQNNEYVVDLIKGEKHDQRTFIKDQEYAVLTRNYKGFWIYNKKDMQIFVSNNDFDNYPNYIENAREYSAWGVQNPYSTTVIPLNGTHLDSRCRVYHLSNNYVNNPNTKHGKVKYLECV